MSEYRTHLEWRRTAPFAYETYNRAHEIRFGSGTQVSASAAPAYRGDADLVNPEETFLSSLSSCHMLTFLAICARKGLVVESYEDDASCVLSKDDAGGLSVTRATLRPKVSFANGPLEEGELRKLHESSHKDCFIARSVKTHIEVLSQ